MILISDPHGCFLTFKALLAKLPKNEKIVVCGDIIDRGPRSFELIEFLINNKIECVRGNHEQMMITPENKDFWINNGGDATFAQYSGNEEAFKLHSEWIKSLPTYRKYEDVKNANGRFLIVSHAAITSLDLEAISESEKIMWNRQEPIDNPEWFNVFGHTPVPEAMIKEWYANIDTGCVYTEVPGLGKLTALIFPSMEIVQQDNIDF